ncbi:MAG: DUF4252 domain-containing protein [Prevotellaceae bacterium]|nr:DUF4252 domain-containing protein [Prevotellaceae bacterium]
MNTSVCHRLCVLPIAPVVLGMLLGCNRSPASGIDVQKAIVSLGVHVHQISIYPTMLTPFLDDKNPEEAMLKSFLKTADNLHIYCLPTKSALNDLTERLDHSGYEQLLNVKQDDHSLRIYGVKKREESVSSLILLLSKSGELSLEDRSYSCYCIEVIGAIGKPEIKLLVNLNPALFDHYIRRFNIQF